MTMIGGLKSIRKERAVLERDRVIIGSMIEDSMVAEAVDNMDSDFFEGVTEDEIEELISKIPESDEDDDRVARILTSPVGLDADEIMGIDVDDETDAEVEI